MFCIPSVVPGLLGNQIEGRLNKTSVPNFFCRKVSDWSILWLSVELLLPEKIDCLSDNLKYVCGCVCVWVIWY